MPSSISKVVANSNRVNLWLSGAGLLTGSAVYAFNSLNSSKDDSSTLGKMLGATLAGAGILGGAMTLFYGYGNVKEAASRIRVQTNTQSPKSIKEDPKLIAPKKPPVGKTDPPGVITPIPRVPEPPVPLPPLPIPVPPPGAGTPPGASAPPQPPPPGVQPPALIPVPPNPGGPPLVFGPGHNGRLNFSDVQHVRGTIDELLNNIEGADSQLAMNSMFELVYRHLVSGRNMDRDTAIKISGGLFLDKSPSECPRLIGFLAGLDKYKPGVSNLKHHITNRKNLAEIIDWVEDDHYSVANSQHPLIPNVELALKSAITKESITRNQYRSALINNDGNLKILRIDGKRELFFDCLQTLDPVIAMEAMHEVMCRYMLDGQVLDNEHALEIVEALLLDPEETVAMMDGMELSPSEVASQKLNLGDPRLERNGVGLLELGEARFLGLIKVLDKMNAVSGSSKDRQIRSNLDKLNAMVVKVLVGEESNADIADPFVKRCLKISENVLDHKSGQIYKQRNSNRRQRAAFFQVGIVV